MKGLAGQNDTFVGHPVFGKVYGNSLYNVAVYFEEVNLNATKADNELAVLYDSEGKDNLVAGPDSAQMTYEEGTVVNANDFRDVCAYSRKGGTVTDTATLNGRDGQTDKFKGQPGFSWVYGSDFYNQAHDFEVVNLNGTKGDNEYARLNDSEGNDTLVANPDSVEMKYKDGTVDETVVKANDFRQVYAHAINGGTDTATLNGRNGQKDTFKCKAQISMAYALGDYYNWANSFEVVNLNAVGADGDKVFLYADPEQPDLLLVPYVVDSDSDPAWARFSNADQVIYVDDCDLVAETSQSYIDCALVKEAFVDKVQTLGDWLTVALGVAGDSLSDEYAEETYSYAANWVESLACNRVYLGEYREDTAVWQDVRGEGYQYNWAAAGATSQSLLTEEQHTGLAEQINDGMVTHAVLAIGQNDFYPDSEAYRKIYEGLWAQTAIDAYNRAVARNIDTALATLTAADVKLVLSNVIDYGVAPEVRATKPDAAKRERVANAIGELNTRIEELAGNYQIPVVDSFGLSKAYFGENGAEEPFQWVGGVRIENSFGEDSHNAFVGDGIHPHTVVQACLANLFVEAFNLGYSTDLAPYTDEEMLILAGLGDEYDELGQSLAINYADYVILPPTGTASQLDKIWLGIAIEQEMERNASPRQNDDGKGIDPAALDWLVTMGWE